MQFFSITQASKDTGVRYLGSVNLTTKHKKAYNYKEMVYGLYLAPAKLSGYEVCPGRNKECTSLCLNGSGMSILYEDYINKSRIKKTKMFFENREYFVRWVIHEIKLAKIRVEKNGYKFSVRLNNTSDISPTQFYINDNGVKKNLLEIFPDVQFYDYTKVSNRVKLMEKYKNYDLTYSFKGYNLDTCLEMLKNNVRVAVVFKNVPETFMGYPVINGDEYDMRYIDPKQCIVGLKFKVVKPRITETTKFVVQ